MRDARFELLGVDDRDALGEGPWWDTIGERLWWVDIRGAVIRNATLDGVEAARLQAPSSVGFAVPDDTGGLFAGLRDGLYRHTAVAGWRQVWAGDYDSSDHRVNDGKSDRHGNLWFGTMHDPETEQSSAFYRTVDGRVERVFSGVTTSNGLGWAPDGGTFYYTDSLARKIWAFDCDPESGALSNRRVFAEDPRGYVPDGLTVDADGAVWAAKWDGGKIVRYRPDGTTDVELRLPVRRPTSAMFVGADLSTLAVTSANLTPDDGELAGAVFLIPTTTSGLPQTRARVAPEGGASPAITE
ncbi:sugar lactone lactonase YvrE [Compostimonas suwonensis]|uniref:Sugar lactone lactonase YvrE n=1 Tax=Compostimonas suwonensis TaxID=1048394 RepID=A0A2M9BYS9_9MICO|nr:sugar lactone lactonase YvrE [Compostimonas suwonensis]